MKKTPGWPEAFSKGRCAGRYQRSANRVVEALIRKGSGTHCSRPSHHLHYPKARTYGDQVKNIAEEIIFYLEAKVLKHGSGKVIED